MLSPSWSNDHFCRAEAPIYKSAQLTPSALPVDFKTTKESFKKRARAKYFTNGVVNRLRLLKDSPLHQSYLNTYFCSSTLTQEGNKLSSKYCNNRWCTVCNRMRTAKLIRGYEDPLKALKDPWFLTLTIPNVHEAPLKLAIATMVSNFQGIVKHVRKYKKLDVKLIRKLESTVNIGNYDQVARLKEDLCGDDRNSAHIIEDSALAPYHPHFHVLVDGYQVANQILQEWMKRYPDASRKGQDLRPADAGSIKELFKYFTKMVTKNKKTGKTSLYPAKAMDVIFQAMVGRRVFQPVGIRKVAEDIEDLQSVIIEDIAADHKQWSWSVTDIADKKVLADWIDMNTGEALTGYEPSEALQDLLRNTADTGPPGPILLNLKEVLRLFDLEKTQTDINKT